MLGMHIYIYTHRVPQQLTLPTLVICDDITQINKYVDGILCHTW